MLHGRRHSINFLTGYSTAFRLGPPRRHDRGELGSDLARSRRRNLKVPCDLEGQGQRGRVVVLGDRRYEDPRLDVDGHRVQVIRRRKTPAVLSLVEERVITEVVVCVGNEDREHDPAPQRLHVLHRRSAIPPQHVHEFKLASRLVVLRAEHTHGGEKRLATPFDAIETCSESTGCPETSSSRTVGTAMPALPASVSATASHATTLISSSRRGNFT